MAIINSLHRRQGSSQPSVLREDLNFAPFDTRALTALCLALKLWQLPIMAITNSPTPLFCLKKPAWNLHLWMNKANETTATSVPALLNNFPRLVFSNYGNYQLWQLPIPPPFFFPKNLH